MYLIRHSLKNRVTYPEDPYYKLPVSTGGKWVTRLGKFCKIEVHVLVLQKELWREIGSRNKTLLNDRTRKLLSDDSSENIYTIYKIYKII